MRELVQQAPQLSVLERRQVSGCAPNTRLPGNVEAYNMRIMSEHVMRIAEIEFRTDIPREQFTARALERD